jgi:maleylpyruvate isomerase
VTAPRLVLFGYFRSSSSYRVRLALAAKGVAHEAVAVNLLSGEQQGPEHARRSPTGYVPCLTVDGRPFVESVAIVELLEDLFPVPPLYPKDPFARARVRAMVEVVNSGIQPLQNLGVLARVSGDGPARKEWAAHYNARGLAALARMVEEAREQGAVTGVDAGSIAGAFCFGGRLTAADVFLVPQLYSARRFGVDVAAYPRLLEAEAATLALPGMRAATPEDQPDAPREPAEARGPAR